MKTGCPTAVSKITHLHKLFNTLISFPKKRVGSVTLEELCAIDEYPNGLYLFFNDENELWYVGKATSRSFIERIPAHFDQREIAWFNTLPKKVMKFCNIQTYREALNKSLSLKLMIVGIQDKNSPMKLETVLRSYLAKLLQKVKMFHRISSNSFIY